ncbi:MAG: DUF839 domain-containing protein [Actinobacteria bacterium]|nr:DUF839 domain-containing protein [Actinomycetota bacterium]
MSIHGNWDVRRTSRRRFLGTAGATVAGVALGGRSALAANGAGSGSYGPLVPDPGGMLDLPRGFQYRVLSAEGALLSNGAPVPGDHDGMAAFAGKGNTTVLVRNHELRGAEQPEVPQSNPYDGDEAGGTTAVVVRPNRTELDSYVTSSGTRNNCAGGATPWGTWVTCEEDRTDGHGYCFEVMWDDPENVLSKTPIEAMGFFSHEAIDVDPATGFVYLTEDDFRGRIDPTNPVNDTRSSFLFRFRPNDRRQRPGALLGGGTLEALAIESAPLADADFFNPGQSFGVVWKTVDPVEPHAAALAQGCVRFNRLEGCHFAGGAFWFDDTAGGEARLGQVFRYLPETNTLELFYEGTDANELESPDNLIVTPWGDIWLAEDGDDANRVIGITAEGEVYEFANNRVDGQAEFAGPTFSPDGRTFFVNVQTPGITYAIWGPFARAHRAGQARMSHAAPPAALAPRVPGALAEAASRHGLTRLEAAAFDRLGVPLL